MIAPIEITGSVTGLQEVVGRFRARSERARAIVTTHVERATISLQNRVKFSYLSGQALNKRTGRLINSVNERVTETADTITGTVGTKVPYGRFWELGFHGMEEVRAHVRRVSSRSVFGKNAEGKRRKLAQGIGFVPSHARQVNQMARPFLRPALEAERANIRREMEAAVSEIAKP